MLKGIQTFDFLTNALIFKIGLVYGLVYGPGLPYTLSIKTNGLSHVGKLADKSFNLE